MNNWWLALFLRKEGYRIYLPGWVFTLIKILFALFVIAVLIYTVNLFMTLEKRTESHHVQSHHTRP
jgi:hypothetical protein